MSCYMIIVCSLQGRTGTQPTPGVTFSFRDLENRFVDQHLTFIFSNPKYIKKPVRFLFLALQQEQEKPAKFTAASRSRR